MRTIETNCLTGWVETKLPRLWFLSLVLISLLFSTTVSGQWINVSAPSGGFAIDGGLRANTPTSPSPFGVNQGDWYPGLVSGTGGSVFDANGVPFKDSTSGRRTDLANSNIDNVFTSGSKFNDYIGSLKWANSGALDKGDINNALYHVSRDPDNKQWVFIAGDRASTNGTSYIDFEFLQGDVIKNADGTFTGNPVTTKNYGGGRTENDLIVSMEYTSGGSKPNVYFYQWKKSGNTWSWQQFTPDAGTAFAETNRAAETNLPYTAFGISSYPDSLQFLEAAINITALIRGTSSACEGLNIKTLWVKTKASATSTAALKDFIDPISVTFDFKGTTTINGLSNSYCKSDNNAVTLTGTPSGGTFTLDGTTINPATFTPADLSLGKHTIGYSYSGCSVSNDFTVVANPTKPVLTGSSICSSNAGTGTITSSTSQNGVSYQLKDGSNNNVQAAQAGTGSGLTWSNLSAGTGYYVVATGASPTSCTATSDPVNVTSVTNPTKPVLTGSSICSSAAGTGTITSSTSQNGVSYQLKDGSNNNVQAAQAGTGSALTWSNLSAGTGYYVVATGASPTSCTATSDPVNVASVANPTKPVLTGSSICSSAAGTGTITSSTSQNGVSYQLKDGSNNNVQAAQAGTGSGLTWSNLSAGTGYYVVATGASPTSCTATSDPVNVTSVTNPTKPVLTGSSICSSAAGTGTITSSTSQNGVSYQLKDGSNNNVQVAQAGTGSGLTWSNLSAGTGYYVVATGASPTSCTATSDPVNVTSVTNPTALVLTGSSICSSNPGTGTITSTSSQNGVSYQLKDGSNNNVQAAQAGTGSGLTWSNLSAGTGYHVVSTGGSPTNCSGGSNSVNVAVVTNPDQPQVTIVEPSLCGAPTATLTVTNPNVGATYALTQDAGGINPTPVEYHSGTLSFAGLIPGKHFYIKANVGVCASAETNCSNYLPAPTTQQRVIDPANNVMGSQPTVKAFPNPFSDQVKFAISSPAAGEGSLDIYNVMGQKVKSVYQGRVLAGNNSFEVTIPKKEQQTLIYMFRVGDKKVTGKLLQLNN